LKGRPDIAIPNAKSATRMRELKIIVLGFNENHKATLPLQIIKEKIKKVIMMTVEKNIILAMGLLVIDIRKN
jgi:hypothetical protein